MTDIRQAFAAAVRAARKRNNLAQLQLAELAGMSLDAVGALEREVNVPTIETAEKLIGALGIDPGAVFVATAEPRRMTAARRDLEAEIFRQVAGMNDRGAALMVELGAAVLRNNPATLASVRQARKD